MAVTKDKLFKGITANYWRITKLDIDYNRSSAIIIVSLYKNEDTRNSDKNHCLDTVAIDLNKYFHSKEYSNGQDVMKNISLKEAYKALKELAIIEKDKLVEKNEDLAFFSDAIDRV